MQSISIIIPVYNAKDDLEKLFRCLDKNDFQESDEIIIVDNGSNDGSFEICKKKQSEKPDLYRVLKYDLIASSYAARNYGVSHAKGDILAFTDSDCNPTNKWMASIRDNISRGCILAGKIQLDVLDEHSVWEVFDTIAHLQSEKNAQNNSVATANMAVSKIDFDNVGMFEERFSGGDYIWSQKAASEGLAVKFVSEMLVHHPTRKTYKAIETKQKRIAYGDGDSVKKNGKSRIVLTLKYFLRIFKIDTNIRYSTLLKKNGIGAVDIIKFFCRFEQLRMEQLKYAIKGYNGEDVRKKGIK